MARPVRRIALLAATVALAALACAPAAALADTFDRVFADYQRDGQIDACKHSEGELKRAKAQVPNDIEQYAPDFPAALDAALEERARGGCRGGAAGGGDAAQPGAAATGTPGAGGGDTAGGGAPAIPDGGQAAGHANDSAATPAPPGAQRATPAASDGAIARAAARGERQSEAGAPAPLIALAVLAGLLVLALLAYALVRWLAWSPRWAGSTRHAIAEAGWRTGGAWSNFTDWIRTRRGPPQSA